MKKTQPVVLGTVALSWSALMMSHHQVVAQPAMSDDSIPRLLAVDANRPFDEDGPDGPRNDRPPYTPDSPRMGLNRVPDLTPEQQQQIRAIQDRTRREIDAILTPAQRERLEQSREQRDGRRRGPQDFGGAPSDVPSRGGSFFGRPREQGFRGDGPYGNGPRGAQNGGGRNGRRGGPREANPYGARFGEEPRSVGAEGAGPRSTFNNDGSRAGGVMNRGSVERPDIADRNPLDSMAWMLDLKSDQQKKIKAILNKAQASENAVRRNTALAAPQQSAELRRIHDQVNQQIEAVLTPAQRQQRQQSIQQEPKRDWRQFDGLPMGRPRVR